MKFKRLYFIVKIFFTYGLDDLFNKVNLNLPVFFCKKILFWIPNRHKDEFIGKRLRLALQELGPIWIKFGQMLSTRRDLLPSHIVDQLAILQNKVIPFDGKLAKKQIEKAMGNTPIENWFDDFNVKPLASASIAQVHSSKIKENGREVIIKVIRPDIFPVIKADIKLIYYLVRLISHLTSNIKHLNLVNVVKEYEKILINELNLLRESANALKLRDNFKNSKLLYIPKVYSDFCSKNIMVMERIYGIPISDINSLKNNGTNMKLLAERGIQVFFTQVFRDSFFHADMHPGNIFVSYEHPEDPQYIAVDFGIVGSLSKKDKLYLAKNFIAFFNKDYYKVAELHIDSGWAPLNINVEEFAFAIRNVCEPIFEKPLEEISFGNVLLSLFKIARSFNMELQPQLILLQRTLLYVEGLGRQLYPKLNLWNTAKPFLESWIKDQIGFTGLIRSLKERSHFWIEVAPYIPDVIYDVLYQNQNLKFNVDKTLYKMELCHIRCIKSNYLFCIGTVLIISGILLITSVLLSKTMSLLLIFSGIIIWIVGWIKILK